MASRKLVKKLYGNLAEYRLYKKEISGHNSNYLHMVPESSLELLPNGYILIALRSIEASLMSIHFSRHLVMDKLKIILGALSNMDEYNREQECEVMDVMGLINQYQGVKTLLSILSAPDLGTKCCDLDNCKESYNIWDIKASTLNIICRLTTLDTSIGEELCESSEVLQLLFSLMGNAHTYSRAATLIEHLFILRKNTLQLNTVPGLDRLISQLDGNYLANFCNILAVTISDLDVYENKPSLYEQSQLKNNNKSLSPLRDINQGFVLSIPEFLPRLVDYATKLPYEPRFQGITVEKDHWMRLIEDSISNILNQNCSTTSYVLERYQNEFPNLTLEGIVEPMLHRVETVYILGLLLLGERRKKVQAQLAHLRLIPRLSKLFDHFIWRCDGYQERLRVPGHQSSCECSPEVALKIQFLRLVHSFCDQSEYRYLMLTPVEYQEVCGLNNAQSRTGLDYSLGQTSAPLSPNQYPPELMCCGSQGLLSKIIEALKRENTGSTFRFWFSRAIESYLRSSTPFADQLFLLRRGLQEHLTASLLQGDLGPNQKEVLQSTFDLLGELLKFNLEAFRRLDHLITAGTKEKKLFRLVRNNLVDSNMLVRSLVLSHDRFTSEGGYPMQYAAVSHTLSHVASFAQRLDFLVRLIKTVNVTTLTQENVSCLNTSLVILMVGHRRSELPLYLEGLRKHAEPQLLPNLRSLLLFWQTHYLHNKDKDCNTLQRSSGISFDFWRETVSTLVAENKFTPECIFHYLTPEDLNNSRTS
ncbi:short transient receptor potential channel 4-associated protein-like isoform X2 [Oratosquilla oratoria]|uniref:short transient receptor potential channel 4-associated protein-like isoform X2 n=1 Tax=Oratosquilla oratoria TaxID=337810 RepID=UPI003F75AD45